jgi:hypothetical protein
MVNGSGTTVRSNQMLALPGKTRATATAPAASPGTEKMSACPIKYGPTRFSKSLVSLRVTHHPRRRRQLPHLLRVRPQLLLHRKPLRRRPQPDPRLFHELAQHQYRARSFADEKENALPNPLPQNLSYDARH